MSKAASHQAIKRDDFLKMSADKNAHFQVPVPPSLLDHNDDDDDFEATEGARLQPINVTVLKDIIQKKVQKLSGFAAIPQKKIEKLSLPLTGLRSRQTSNSSLKSLESGKFSEIL
jgi:hypothetical protein